MAYFPSNVDGAFSLTLIGQTLIGLAQPCFLNSPPKIANVYFPLERRALAVSLALVGQLVGAAIAFAVIPSLVTTREEILPLVSSKF